jgi:hypothetical protein
VECGYFDSGKMKELKYKVGEYDIKIWFYETGFPKGELVSRIEEMVSFRKYDESGILAYEEIYENGIKTKKILYEKVKDGK